MKPPKVISRVIWAAGALASLRLALVLMADTRRYDRARAMSNDGPLIAQIPEIVAQAIAAERKALPGMFSALATLPQDAWRYARLRAM
jgi:hypothetical protein